MTSGVSATMRIRSPSPAPVASMSARWVVVGQELRDRALDLAAGLEREVGQALRPEPAGALGQLVDLAAGDAGHAGRDDGLDPAAGGQRVVEDPETRRRRAGQRRRQVDELHPEADVRLVAAEPLHDLVVGEARERELAGSAGRASVAARDLDRHRLDEGHHRLLVDEAHLEVELGELGLAVAAQVLVAVAAGDLEVAVDARRPSAAA